MFRRERQFNIITGESAAKYISQTSRSCASELQNYRKTQKLVTSNHKLGVPKDAKEFQYSYFELPKLSNLSKIETESNAKKNQSFQNRSMLNYVSTRYNVINHGGQIQTAKIASKNMFLEKMPEIFKKSPLTQHIHRARKYAPNYHEDYEKRVNEQEFHKKTLLCSQICQIQKTYGRNRYFRKFK